MAATPGDNPTSTGLAVSCDLSSIGGSAAQTFFDDGTNGDLTASDSTFSFFTTVPPSTTAGLKNLLCTITDAQTRSGNASISLDVLTILPIGTVQGSVGDADNGLTHGSPYAGQIVYIQGVIYEKTLARTSGGALVIMVSLSRIPPATADSRPQFIRWDFCLYGHTHRPHRWVCARCRR